MSIIMFFSVCSPVYFRSCMKDECNLCGRVLSLYALKRCPRCKKLYCRSCMTLNLWSESRDLVCLNCARSIVAPKRAGSKYGPLREYLWRRGQYTSLVTLTFSRIEGIIKGDLPFGALRDKEWWNNNKASSQGYSWTSVGWQVQSVDLEERTVTLKKQFHEKAAVPRRRRRKAVKAQKPFTPVPDKPRRIPKPSKTRIARVVARAKNVERRQAAASYKMRKPKSAYEKRLYKPEAKPAS
jgi:hypothetical protein